jgi:hypothetical protein
MILSPKQVFEQFKDSMLAHSDTWMNLIAEDVLLVGPLAQINDKAGFIEINKPFFASIQNYTVHNVIESGDLVITRVSIEVEMPSKNKITLDVSEWYTIKNNRIQALHVYFDTQAFRQEMS